MYLEDKKLPEPQVEQAEEWRQDLLNAAEYIRINGWHQHGLYAKCSTAVCVRGALYRTLPGPELRLRCVDAEEKLRTFLGIKWLPAWNDCCTRTKKQVLTAIEDCAKQG